MALGEVTLFFVALFIFLLVLIGKHCSPGENQVTGGGCCDFGLVGLRPDLTRRGQSLVTSGALGVTGGGALGAAALEFKKPLV